MPSASIPRLALVFLRAGSLTFGGGDPTVAVLYAELVSARGWLAPEKYGLVYALARVTPGTNMLAFCAGAAWEVLGWRAAVAAVLAATLPSAAAVVLLTAGFEAVQSNGPAMAAIAGTLAAAVGMMLSGAWQLARPHLARRRWPRAVALAGGAFALSFLWGASPIVVLAAAAAIGCFWRVPEAA